jgi:hypothetical protein
MAILSRVEPSNDVASPSQKKLSGGLGGGVLLRRGRRNFKRAVIESLGWGRKSEKMSGEMRERESHYFCRSGRKVILGILGARRKRWLVDLEWLNERGV